MTMIKNLVFVLVTIVNVMQIKTTEFMSLEPSCDEPSLEDMFYLKEDLLCASRSWMEEAGETPEVRSHLQPYIDGHGHCPSMSSLQGLGIFHTCPSYEVEDRDETRIPVTIIHHFCRCHRCLGANNRHLCRPIFRRIPVLRSTCGANGVRNYTLTEENLSVGCTCYKRATTKRKRSKNRRKRHDRMGKKMTSRN